MFRCPVCREPLTRHDRDLGHAKTWTCSRGHSYDVAREGYVNLLITHQRRTREPGDSAAMLRHRRAFLDAGHFDPVARALRAAHTQRDVEDGDSTPSVLDAGCGEGYYTRDWPEVVWGVDIAKAAVRMAAKRAPRHNYAVASVYDLPIVDASIDTVVNVFAPVHSAELIRTLKPGGRLLTVTPGPDHLAGLKALLFAEPEQHADRGPLDDAGVESGFSLHDRQRVTYALTVGQPAIADLLGMIPYAWYVDAATREKVAGESSLLTPIDVNVSVYERTERATT